MVGVCVFRVAGGFFWIFEASVKCAEFFPLLTSQFSSNRVCVGWTPVCIRASAKSDPGGDSLARSDERAIGEKVVGCGADNRREEMSVAP
jgi:hypothetical protein